MSIVTLLNQSYFPAITTFDWTTVFYGVSALLTSVLIALLFYSLFHISLTLRLSNLPSIILEVKPLRVTEQSAFSTQQLFNLLHGIGQQRSLIYRLFRVGKSFSFEIVSHKESGIRYLVRADEDSADLIKKSLLSYLPGVSVNPVPDYLDSASNPIRCIEYGLSNHFAFPLKSHEKLEKSDPVAYLTGAMTTLSDRELLAFQIVSQPLRKSTSKEIRRVSKLIYAQKDLLRGMKAPMSSSDSVQALFGLLLQILLLPIGIIVFVLTDGKDGPMLPVSFMKNNSKTDNLYQQELETQIKQKLDQPLFTTSIRLLVSSTSVKDLGKRQRGFSSALTSMSASNYQIIKPIFRLKCDFIENLKFKLFKKRLLTPLKRSILSSSEMSDIYHFPFTQTTKTEDLLKQHSKELPTPLSLKKTHDLDVVFAQNTYGSSTTQIGLNADERRRHVYILGATGTGKSTMLLTMINEDLKNNKGLAVIDPHGDLVDQILHIIPKERIGDVVYFNPDDIAYPMGINVLELSSGLNDDDALREKEFITESVISLFHKVYTEKYSGPRLEYILRNTIHTAFYVPGATLFTVNKLLINTKFRKSVVRNLTDENLREFWQYEFAKAGDYQKVKMILPITNKIGRFLFSPTAKRIFEQEKSTINFDEIMNEGKILLCNLSKGKIGEDNSQVFGAVMMAKIQLSALKRARIPMDKRKDFYLYVDEFQNFASESFAQILSEARKYKLNAILAHQTTSQLEDKSLVNVTLANTGTVICFRTANPEDEKLILPQFRPYVEEGEIASLPSYRFYMRLGALNPEEPFSGITVPVDSKEDPERAKQVIDASRSRYAIKYEDFNKPQIKIPNPGNTSKQITVKNEAFSVLP